MNIETITGLIRALLAFIGGIIVAQGWIDAATWTAIGGALLTIFTAVWSALHHTTAANPDVKTIP